MMKTTMIYSLASLLAFSGCSQEADMPPSSRRGEEIMLGGNIDDDLTAEAVTRLPIESTHATVLDVAVARTDQTAATTWTSWASATTLLAKRAATNGTAAITFNTGYEQYYTTGQTNNGIRLVAWYPNTAASSGKVAFTADGKTDIMVSNIAEGSAASKFSTTTNVLTFDHELVRFTVKVYGDAAANTAWGNISEVKFVKVGTKLTWTIGSTSSWSAYADLFLRKEADDANFTGRDFAWSTYDTKAKAGTLGYLLTGSTETVGYASYNLQVTTAKGGARTVNVKLASGNFTPGKHYVIYLQFSATGIVPAASVTSWGTAIDVPGGSFPN